MEKEKIGGCSIHSAEIIVDYNNNKTELKGIPPYSLLSKIGNVFVEWVKTLWIPFLAVLILNSYLQSNTRFYATSNQLFTVFGIVILAGMSLHLNKKLDGKLSKHFARRTAHGKKNRLSVTELNSKEFIIYNTRNVVVNFDTSGDFKKYLSKIWVKEEHPSTILMNQGKLQDLFFTGEQTPFWNVHFIFEKIPKAGCLTVEYI